MGGMPATCNYCDCDWDMFVLNTYFQGLVILYLCVVIFMVRRQLRTVMIDEEEEMEEKVAMINNEGKTDLCPVKTVLNNPSEVMM